MSKSIFFILLSAFGGLFLGFLSQPILGAIIFLFTQFLIGVYLISYKNKKIELTDIRLLLYCVYLLYCIFLPLIMYFELIPFKQEIIPTTVLFGLSFLGLNIANLILPADYPRERISIGSFKRPNRYSVIIHIILLSLFLSLAIKSGISLDNKLGEVSRDEIFKSVSQLWVVLVMLINASSIYNIFYFKRLSKIEKYLFIISTLLYIYIHLQLGNRRDYLPIILSIFLYFGLTRYLKVNLKVLAIISILFFGSFWITIQRDQNVKDIGPDKQIEIALISNEFVYPMQTLMYTIRDQWDLRYGYTYIFMPFEIIIPRNLYPNKPKSLGAEFVSKTFGKGYQGFAYTPTTEAFLNFGYIGPLLIFTIWGLLINILIKYSYKQNYWLYYMVFYSLVFDFSRGDFSSFIYQIFVIFSFLFLLKIKNLRIKLK